jgi:hypothetical protein
VHVNETAKLVPGARIRITNFPPPPPQTPPQRRIELSRTAKIKIKDKDNGNGETEVKEFVIAFDDLDQGDLLGRGQFGTVKKMHHKASNLTFAVKVISPFLINIEIFFSLSNIFKKLEDDRRQFYGNE